MRVEYVPFVCVTTAIRDLRQMQESTVSLDFTYLWQDLRNLCFTFKEASMGRWKKNQSKSCVCSVVLVICECMHKQPSFKRKVRKFTEWCRSHNIKDKSISISSWWVKYTPQSLPPRQIPQSSRRNFKTKVNYVHRNLNIYLFIYLNNLQIKYMCLKQEEELILSKKLGGILKHRKK